MTKSARRSESIPIGLWICGPTACERIIGSVGERYAANVDHDRLTFDLLGAREELLAFVTLDSDAGAREREELFTGILDSAIVFKDRLLDDRGHKYAAREIASRFEGALFDTFLSSLDRTIEAAKALKDENSRGGWVRLERPPKEWFVGEILPRVFESNFGRPAKVHGPTSLKSGPRRQTVRTSDLPSQLCARWACESHPKRSLAPSSRFARAAHGASPDPLLCLDLATIVTARNMVRMSWVF